LSILRDKMMLKHLFKNKEKMLEWPIVLNSKNASFEDIAYYCGSAGHVSQDAVKRYILEQEGKDMFDYNIYGDYTG